MKYSAKRVHRGYFYRGYKITAVNYVNSKEWSIPKLDTTKSFFLTLREAKLEIDKHYESLI